MKIPKSIRIGSMDYEVQITDNAIIVDQKECTGSIDYNEKIIQLSKIKEGKQGKELTFLHEVVHGIVFERNFSYAKCDDETITEELARGLHQVIKDNPDIFMIQEPPKTFDEAVKRLRDEHA